MSSGSQGFFSLDAQAIVTGGYRPACWPHELPSTCFAKHLQAVTSTTVGCGTWLRMALTKCWSTKCWSLHLHPVIGSFCNRSPLLPAALAFPIGFDSQGIPTGLQFAALPGQDSLMLSLAIAVEKLFGPMAPPPTVAGCSGCTATTRNVPVAFNGTGQPNATAAWSYFGLTFNGTCNRSFLTTYGQQGTSRPCGHAHGATVQCWPQKNSLLAQSSC